MYIFAQKEDLEDCEIVNIENQETLRITTENFEKIAVKQKLPVKFAVLERSSDGQYTVDSQSYRLKQANYVYFETHIASRRSTNKAESSMKNLIETFGNKKSKEIYKNMENNQSERRHTKQVFTYEEQILPKFNNTENIEEIYTLVNIFGSELVQELEQVDYEMVDLHESIQKYFGKDKVAVLLLDCFYKVFDKPRIHLKYIDEIFIYGCSSFGSFIEPHLFKGYFTDLGRDKMVAIAYILILMVNDYNVLADDLPRFSCDTSRLSQILKVIGCTYNKKTLKYKLVKAPRSEVTQKRGGIKR